MPTTIRLTSTIGAVGVLAALATSGAGAQAARTPGAAALAARVAAAPGSAATFAFPARAGVCGDGASFIRVGPHQYMGQGWRGGSEADDRACLAGPVRVVVTHAGADVSDVRATVGASVAPAAAADLGTVDAADASAYLLGVAARGAGRGTDRAVLPALLGEGVDAVAVPALLAMVRAAPPTRRGHHEALFWAGRYAAARLRGQASPFAADEGCATDDVRREAVFALSQLRGGQAVPALVDVAEHHHDSCVRGTALFWLGESGDARAGEVIASVLAAR